VTQGVYCFSGKCLLSKKSVTLPGSSFILGYCSLHSPLPEDKTLS